MRLIIPDIEEEVTDKNCLQELKQYLDDNKWLYEVEE